MFVCHSSTHKSSNTIQNQNLLRLRLSYQEKIYYSNLFIQFKDQKSGNVYIDNFPKLLGILGTDIAEEIARRIFDIFSGNKDYITLSEYLKYIDVYHYGDKNERCNLTCKLMDFNNDGQISLEEFNKYINLIIGAVRRVNPYLKSELFSKEDIKVLFNKISNNKDFFTYDEFFMIYNEKPEIVSWIDYFKNDSDDSLLVLNKYIKSIFKNFYNFSNKIINMFKIYYNKKLIEKNNNNKNEFDNFNELMNNMQDSLNKLEKVVNYQNEKFMNFARNNEITLRNLFSLLSQKDEQNIAIDEKNILNNKDKIIENEKNNYLDKINNINSVNLFMDPINENSNNKNNNNVAISRKRINKIKTIKHFFEDIKKNLNLNPDVNKHRLLKSQSVCGKNLFKFFGQDRIKEVSNFELNETKNSNNNKKNDSEGFSDFMISEEDEDEGISTRNINILNYETFFQFKYKQNKINSKENTQSKKNTMNSEENKQNNLDESSKIKTLIVEKSNSFQTDTTDKTNEKYKSFISHLLKYFEKLSKIFFNSMINLNESYKYIESKYLQKDITNIERIKKEEAKKNYIIKLKEKNNNKNKIKINKPKSASTAVTNIPKTKLKTSDDNFKILLNTIMGIQIAVESSPDISEVQNIHQYLHSMTYSIQTSNISKNKQESFMIKEYAGVVFNNIRRLFGYDKESFVQSISPQVFITEIIISNTTSIEEFFNTGSSGSLFYYTRDGKFILKTIDKKEYKTLKRILPRYYQHLIKYKNTFLPKFFGYYKLIRKIKKKKKNFYFIIMMNVFSTKKKIHLRFDLKGSKIGREIVKPKEKKGLTYDTVLGKYNYALKDLDFDFFKKEIHIDSNVRNIIIDQLNIDSLLLRELNINDYSLLLGIHKKKFKKKEQNVNFNINNINNDINMINNDSNSENITSNLSNLSFSYRESESKISQNQEKSSIDKISNSENNKKLKEDYSSERMTISSLNKSYGKNTVDKFEKEENLENKNEQNDGNIWNDFNGIILEDGGIFNEKENEIYYMGIIDILTNYDCLKVGEFMYKSVRYCSKKMSCITPSAYQQRFMDYLKHIIPPDCKTTNLDGEDKKNEKNEN